MVTTVARYRYILMTLRERPFVPADVFTRRLKVSRRTIARDMSNLRQILAAIGIVVEYDRSLKGYVLDFDGRRLQ